MNESHIELESLRILQDLGFDVAFGPDLLPDGINPQRKPDQSYLEQYLREAIARLNPQLPPHAQDEVFKKAIRTVAPDNLTEENRQFHRLLTTGIPIEYRTATGELKTTQANLVDWENPTNNHYQAVNQLTVIENNHNRRPDVVLFINGLPLVLIELKDPTRDDSDLRAAFNQVQVYQQEIPSLFRYNTFSILSDGIKAEAGTISADYERYMPWKTIEGEKEQGNVPQMEVLLRGMCAPERLLDIIRNYLVFELMDKRYVKKLAAYHQYWAVTKAVESTMAAAQGDHRAGVVWHTQGSGKSLSMLCYVAKLQIDQRFNNPTIIVVCDRNDLDNQLFEVFAASQDSLREKPVQAVSRDDLQSLLRRESGGIIFTTNAKFFPETGTEFPLLSERNNIIVIADEAHRSQYNFIDGYAKHVRDALPNANFIGFTGTPIEADDRSTPAVFGPYIDVYDIQQAVADGATVQIHYESRLIDLGLDAQARLELDQRFDDLTEGEELSRQEKLKTKWAQLEAIVGSDKRIKDVAADVVTHFESRQETMDGKGMIVCMSRRICVQLYNEIIALRPHWHSDDDKLGLVKVVMTGSAEDGPEWQQHIRTKECRKALADHMKKSETPLKLVIVRDMWLTGFDVPSMHTMYIDKLMRGHNLMQAIARVNRVYKDKPGGLVVDYLGVAGALREALATYTQSGGQGRPTFDQAEAVAVLREKLEILRALFHGFRYDHFFATTTSEQLKILLAALDFILGVEDGEKRLKQHVAELSKAFALAVPHPQALDVRAEVAFFQAVKARLTKVTEKGKTDADFGAAIRQIVDKAIAPLGVVDIFEAAGLNKPNISILSDEFLAEIRGMEQKNLAAEALAKLLNDEIKTRFAKNVIKQRSFGQMLEEALKKYKNHTIEAAQVIRELIELAESIRTNEDPHGLTAEEIAFYDALIENGSAREVMGDDKLRDLARILVHRVRRKITVDWSIRDQARAALRNEVRKALREYGYPPDEEKLAIDLVIEQTERIAPDVDMEEIEELDLAFSDQ